MLLPRDDAFDMVRARQVELAQTGNNEALTALIRQYEGEIYGYLVGLLGNEEEAHDLTQDTLLKVWQKLATLENVSSFKPWLYCIARNLAFDRLRQRQRRKKISVHSWDELQEDTVVVNSPDPQEYVPETEFLKLALAQVPKNYRDCLLLQVVGGFSQDEVAQVVGIRKDSVATYVSSARRELRKIYQRFEKELHEEEEIGG